MTTGRPVSNVEAQKSNMDAQASNVREHPGVKHGRPGVLILTIQYLSIEATFGISNVNV